MSLFIFFDSVILRNFNNSSHLTALDDVSEWTVTSQMNTLITTMKADTLARTQEAYFKFIIGKSILWILILFKREFQNTFWVLFCNFGLKKLIIFESVFSYIFRSSLYYLSVQLTILVLFYNTLNCTVELLRYYKNVN